ncbi:MAG: hypothetical protein P8Y05_06985 [Deinococcales bacterium]
MSISTWASSSADAQPHLDRVDGLDEEVLGPAGERRLLELGALVAGEHQDRVVVGQVGAQLLDDLQAVLVRHVMVEDEQVGAVLQEALEHAARVVEGGHLRVAGPLEDPLEDHQDGLFVVDQQDLEARQIHAGGIIGCPRAPFREEFPIPPLGSGVHPSPPPHGLNERFGCEVGRLAGHGSSLAEGV